MLSGSPIAWASRKQKTVAISTGEAGYIAGAGAAKKAAWLERHVSNLKLLDLQLTTVLIHPVTRQQ
jgi:hypothetical protein